MMFLVTNTDCHGAMLMPYSWLEYKQWLHLPNGEWTFDYVGTKSWMQCLAGNQIPKELICHDQYTCDGDVGHPGVNCFWFTNNTFRTEMPTMLDPKLRTYANAPNQDKIMLHPWLAPGTAPVFSPCGAAGGNYGGCEGGECSHHRGGFGHGPKAVDVDFKYKFHVTEWARGSVVEVIWGIFANHGGGYSYRLCKLPEEGYSHLTEECFQETPLDFVGDTQWVQYGEDEKSRVAIPATRTKEGTYPEGSHWTKNPIPACNGGYGGFLYPTRECPKGTQFEPPKPDLYGFGVNTAFNITHFPFSIVDLVRIPVGLPAGKFVLSFRWDVEQSSQVWNTCADINLV